MYNTSVGFPNQYDPTKWNFKHVAFKYIQSHAVGNQTNTGLLRLFIKYRRKITKFA